MKHEVTETITRIVRSCDICGARTKTYTCEICGRDVCDTHSTVPFDYDFGNDYRDSVCDDCMEVGGEFLRIINSHCNHCQCDLVVDEKQRWRDAARNALEKKCNVATKADAG